MSTHNMSFWRTGENYPRIIIKYSSLTNPQAEFSRCSNKINCFIKLFNEVLKQL